ncbi:MULTISPECIES: hypothetical protein [unclassified Micromonospora]|uniref:hypothetical protein n=1 Tax=unclassified Micromonospora TaxID=2617518 RepID=UPI002FEEBA4D
MADANAFQAAQAALSLPVPEIRREPRRRICCCEHSGGWMMLFACAGCGARLTVPVSQVALPVHAGQQYGHGLLGVLMEPGTYAVDPDPSGPPWQPWTEVGADEAEARGVYAPVHALSSGPRGAVVVAPGDVRGTVFIPERSGGCCCGLDGRDGPNLACARCGLPVATRIDDCSLWQAVWLDPRAVHRVTGDVCPRQPVGWEALREERPGIPPVEPPGQWSPLWEAAVAAALARLLAVSAGARVIVPDGLVADTFRRALDQLLPPGPPARTLALVGPGLPAVSTGIALVPQHPQTGGHWASSGAAGAVVPLSWDVWTYLAFHHDRRPVPGAGTMPDDARRDDPPPLTPSGPFRPASDVFLSTLARLPEVRQPWLREIYDHVKGRPYADPF